ncbi:MULTISPECIES: glycosyltransferase [Halocynthiibacter]|uniref:Glycosyltransferase n=1 Tax=Halocynthiibacter halioticoli TaxID=2986804 RepID=A0AAE3IYN7_9RHOB|nr:MULTISPECIES: glycosyltransferase [Halocynthiibacter]MCV6824493.1 glycosyltransferase [Halocynthiibacter halioticoli]MCW4057494.1 glycosyltransferase [Halocynthiibacter sp. SDUM655004]
MRVLHCITGLGFGGAQVMLFRYLKGLGEARSNHEVVSLLPPAHFSHEIENLGVRVTSAELPQGKFNLKGLKKIRSHIKDFSPDVIHGWMYHGNFAASVANFGLGSSKRMVWSVHHSLHDINAESRSTQMLIKLSAPMTKRLGAVTYCSKQSQTQHEAFGFSSDKSVLIPNGTNMEEYHARPAARSFLCSLGGIPESRILIGNINRNHPMKDQLSLVKAAKKLIDRGRDIHLIFVGEGHEGGEAAQAVAAFGMQDRFTIIPARNDIPEIVPGLDVFVLSSAWGEAFSLATGEAMASEVPAVVTDVGDSAWLVGDTGAVVPPSNPDALADGIDQIIALPEPERKALGKRARARIDTKFSLDRYIKAHDDLYHRVAESS